MKMRRAIVVLITAALLLGGAAVASAQEQTHTVQPGETLGSIALQYGVTIQDLAFANGIVNPNLIFVGQVLKIPGTAPSGGTTTYTVQSGDTLFAIARRFNTTADAIAKLNGLANPDVLKVGQVLKIPSSGVQPTAAPTTAPTGMPATNAPTSPPTQPPAQAIIYTVKVGDTLSRIALSFGTTYQEIALLNNLADPNLIFPGQVLIIKKGVAATPVPPATFPPTPTNTLAPTVTPTLQPTFPPTPTNTLAPTVTPSPQPTFPPGFQTPTSEVSGTSVPVDASNRLQNPDFEGATHAVGSASVTVGEGWEPFYCDQPYTADKCPALRLGTGNPQGLLMARPNYAMATTPFRVHGGGSAQSWSCPWIACRGGVYQTVDTIPGSTCEAGAAVMSVSANSPTALLSDLITFDDRANSTWFIKVDPQGAPDSAFNTGILTSQGFGYSDGIYDQYVLIKYTFPVTNTQTTVYFENLRLWPLTINDSFIDDAYVKCTQ